MSLVIDSDVESVVAFMQSSIDAERLLGVSDAVAKIAPLIWSGYARRHIDVVSLTNGQIFSGSETLRQAAIESAPATRCAGDDFEAAEDEAEQR